MPTAHAQPSQSDPRDDVTHFCFPFAPPPANPFCADGSAIAFARAGTPIFTHPSLPSTATDEPDDIPLSTAALVQRLSLQLNAACADVEQLRLRLAAQCAEVGVRGCCGRHCRHMWYRKSARGTQCTLHRTEMADSDATDRYRSTDATDNDVHARADTDAPIPGAAPADEKGSVPEMTSSPCSSARSTPSLRGRASEHAQERKPLEHVAGSRPDDVAECVASPRRSEQNVVFKSTEATPARKSSTEGGDMPSSACTSARSTPHRESVNVGESACATEGRHTDPSDETESMSPVLCRKGATGAVHPAQYCAAKERDPPAGDELLTSTAQTGGSGRQSVASIDAAEKMPVSACSSAFSTPVAQKGRPGADCSRRHTHGSVVSSAADSDSGRVAGASGHGSMCGAREEGVVAAESDVAGGTGSAHCAKDEEDNDVMARAFARRNGDSLAIARVLFSEHERGSEEVDETSGVSETVTVDTVVEQESLPKSEEDLTMVPGCNIAPEHVVRVTAQRLHAAGKRFGTQKVGADTQCARSEEAQEMDDGEGTSDDVSATRRDDIARHGDEALSNICENVADLPCSSKESETDILAVHSGSESSSVRQAAESSSKVTGGADEGESTSPDIVFFDAPSTFIDGAPLDITSAQRKTSTSQSKVGLDPASKSTVYTKAAATVSAFSSRYDGDRPAFCMGSVPAKLYRRLPTSAKWGAPSLRAKACSLVPTPVAPPSDTPAAPQRTAAEMSAGWPSGHKGGDAEIQEVRAGASEGGAVRKDAESECRREVDDALKSECIESGATGQCGEEDDESRQLVISGIVRGAPSSAIREPASGDVRHDPGNQNLATHVIANRSRNTGEENILRGGEDIATTVLEGREQKDAAQGHAAPQVECDIPVQHVFLCVLLGLLSLMSLAN